MNDTYQNDIEQSLEALRAGGVILCPTDTIWGLSCNASDENAVAKIFSIKNRSEEKNMIILVSDIDSINSYAETPSEKIRSLINDSERPVTVVFPRAKNLAASLLHNDGTIAIRVVKAGFCFELIEGYGKALVSTSANISGEQAPRNFADVPAEIKSKADYIVQHDQQNTDVSSPSLVVKWMDDDTIITLRN